MRVEYEGGSLEVQAGQAVVGHKGEWVRYSTPAAEGAEYFAICVPAFTTTTPSSPICTPTLLTALASR